eukprot:398994_1
MAHVLHETECLDLACFLQLHNLSHLKPKFDGQNLTIEDLINCTESDIRELCNELGFSAISRMKLIKAVKALPDAKINEPEKQIIFLGAEEKKIIDKLNKKNELTCSNMKKLQIVIDELEKSSIECTKEVHDKYNEMVSIMDKHRKLLLDKIIHLKNKRKQELETYFNQLKLLND